MKQFIFLILFGYCLSSCYTQSDNGNFLTYSELDTELQDKIAERKIQYSATISITVEQIDTAIVLIDRIAKKHKGYTQETNPSKTTIYVNSNALQPTLEDISTLGSVKHHSTIAKDVTEAFTDYNIRLDNAQKARTRYLELLKQAENVEAALKIEKELERLNETIDLIKGKLKRLNHKLDMTPVTIFLTEKKHPGILGYIGIGLYHSVKWLFVRN